MNTKPKILHKIIDGVERKRCSGCKEWLPLKLFRISRTMWDGLSRMCKKCASNYDKAYYIKNREKILITDSIRREKNKEKNKKIQAAYYRKNKEKIKNKVRKWEKDNLDKVRIYKTKHNKKYRSTLKGSLHKRMAGAMRKALKGNKSGRHWEVLVNYTLEDLQKRLQHTMPNGYIWQDYLNGKLHIDHKIPISVFNFEKPEDDDFQRCFALKNLQLLPAIDNIIKSNKIDKHFQPSLKF